MVIYPDTRYPVVDGIPYLRTGREQLRTAVLECLDAGHTRKALSLLLQDQDDWARTPPPSIEAIQPVIDGGLSLREAMQALNFGPVADYFAYRWSDPTFLSGLALLETHLPGDATVFELACGIGHYLREFELRGIPAIGGDVVFAKLWLARRYVAPNSQLICFDAGSPFPLASGSVRAAFCHDALYFLRNKAHVAAELRRVVGPTGAILIGHTHNAAADNFSSGEPLLPEQYAALFPGAVQYDDAELTRSAVAGRSPQPGVPSKAPAIALASGAVCGTVRFTVPAPGAPLQINPLLTSGRLSPEWPSERYEQEYAPLSQYLHLTEPPPLAPTDDLIRRRVFVSLPEQW